jgi:hypothetical protein
MTKANHLLETSKDYFIQPSIPSIIIEKKSTSPPILPDFNTIDNSPQINRNSFEQKYQNDSIIWSDEEDDEHNQSFLPIGLPPIHHRSIIPTTISPPSHIEHNSTYQEQQDDIDIRPLNNLSTFNFDCQQMNAERIDGKIYFFYFLSILIFILDSDHNRFSPEILNEHKKPSLQSINSSNSRSPPPQTPDMNTPLKQVDLSIRKKTLPNFFPSNHQMEVSIKQVSQALTTSVNYFLFYLSFIYLFCFVLFKDNESKTN